MRRTVSTLFWETACVLRFQWDPNKDPIFGNGYRLDPSQTSGLRTAETFRDCDTDAQTPILVYASLEILLEKNHGNKDRETRPGTWVEKDEKKNG